MSSLQPMFEEEVLEQNLLREDEELVSLLVKEQENEMYEGYELNPHWAEARRDAVEWVLKAAGFYSFSALTAVLAVNYLDRFFYSFNSQKEKLWMPQLVAVACLSLAAKVEEIRVPLLLDLQVEEAEYVFESRTIQRMEILVLSTLEWKMNPLTWHSFLDFFARRLISDAHLAKDFLRKCHCLLLSVISDSRFTGYQPSALATAAMLYVIRSINPRTGKHYQDLLTQVLGIKKEKVEDCCRLIQAIATSATSHTQEKIRIISRPPHRDDGDASFPSDRS